MEAAATFPLGYEFQCQLLKLLTVDSRFATSIFKYLRPEFFENQVLQWAMDVLIKHRDRYNQLPSLHVVLDESRRLGPDHQAIYRATVESVIATPIRDDHWLRDQVLDFIKRGIFVKSFHEAKASYNSGKVTDAYDTMQKSMDELQRATWDPAARTFFFEDLSARMVRRTEANLAAEYIPTGFPTLDKILGGGARKGEAHAWVAFPKVGKSTLLQNHGVAAVRNALRNVLHIVFEGRMAQFEDRYDAAFSQAAYADVKRGIVDADAYARLRQEYQMYRQCLVMRDFTHRWENTVLDIQEELLALKRDYNWVPDLIIVDYADLMSGRNGPYRGEREKQKDAYRDIKSLANRGYAVWTATQAVRPDEKDDVTQHLLKARDVADAYDKVRILDFIGTINQTLEERRLHAMRLYPDTARDVQLNGQAFAVVDDRSRMTIREGTAQLDRIYGGNYSQVHPDHLKNATGIDYQPTYQ